MFFNIIMLRKDYFFFNNENIDSTQSDVSMNIITYDHVIDALLRSKIKINCVDFWDRFRPNIKRPYSNSIEHS